MKLIIITLFFCSSLTGQIQGVDQFVIMSETDLIDTALVLDFNTQLWNNYEDLTGDSPEETKDIGKVKRYFTDIDSLPDYGELCEKNCFYNYMNTDTVFCRQSHNRTIYTPYETPALFSFSRYDNGSLEWIENEYVYVDSTRIYNEVAYTVLQEHLTQDSWNPELTVGVLWKLKSTSNDCETALEWNASDHWTTYTVGDLRTNDSSLWEVTNVAYTYYEPSGAYGYLGWVKIQDCE